MKGKKTTFQDLNADCLMTIMSFIPERELSILKMVSKQFYKAIKLLYKFRYNKNYLSDVYEKSFLSQSYMIQHIMKSRERESKLIVCNSPVGTGKTAMALWVAVNSTEDTTILITPKTITSWYEEVKKWGLYNSPPKKSKVLFVHTTINKEHKKYYENSDIKGKIIIMTTKYKNKKPLRTPNLIVDEAHLLKLELIVDDDIKEIILFSASPISVNQKKLTHITNTTAFMNNPNISQKDKTHANNYISQGLPVRDSLSFKMWYGKPYIIEFFPFKANLDKKIDMHAIGGDYAKMHYKFFKGKASHSKSDSLDSDDDELYFDDTHIEVSNEDMLFFAKKYDTIVVMVKSNMETTKALVKSLNIPTHHVLFFQNTSKTILKKFREEKCIVFCTYKTASEGINFSEAQCLVCYDFWANSVEKAKQVLGRVKRLNNTESDIDVYFEININRYRTHFVLTKLNYYYGTGKCYRLEKKGHNSITKIIDTLGIDVVEKLSMSEMLLLFSSGRHSFKEFKTDIEINLFLSLVYLS